MAKKSLSNEISDVLHSGNLTGSKKMSEIGNIIKSKTKDYAQTVNTKTAQQNVAKWGLAAATTGAGVGAGVYATSMGLSGAANNLNPLTDSNGNVNWGKVIIWGGLIALLVLFINNRWRKR